MNTTRALTLSLALMLLGLILLVLAAPTARAADPVILRVTVDGATSDLSCGTSWANPCGLDYALSTVAASGTELWVAAGTYTPTIGVTRTATFQLQPGVALYGGFAMTETLRTQRNFTANLTILSGDIGTPGDSSDNAYHVVKGSGVTNTAVLDGFTVTGGKADGAFGPDWLGGGMYDLNGSPTVANVTFSNNSAHFGGGMYNTGSSPTLSNTAFISNSASGGGGGMSNWNMSNPTLSNVTFSENSAHLGGGMHNYSWSNPTLSSATFISNNASSYGGGMYNELKSSPMLTNTTFISNTAVDNGGGIGNDQSNPTLTNVTFSGNTASAGGGLYNYNKSSPRVYNTIFWGNSALYDSQIQDYYISWTNVFDSVVQDGYAGGTHILTTDPHLGALGNWGGSTPTIPLLRGSSAIDAGNDATCPLTDQRGKPRVGTCDIGAFEFQGYTLAKTGGDHQSTLVNTSFASSLQVTLTETESGLPVAGATITFTSPSSGASAAWSGNLVQTATTNASGAAAVSPPTANGIAGSYTVTATTSGATAPVMFALTNLKHDTTTVITPLANPSIRGETITFTAVVSGASPGGSVAFKDGAESLAGCSAVSLSAGSATCTVSSLTAGSHNITAAYSGDANNDSSTGALTFIVDKAHTTTVITSSANPVVAAHPVTLTVTVSPVAPGSGTPTGTVDLTETSPALAAVRGTPRALASHTLVDGVAAFSLPSLTPGAHAFLATYSGDANYDASTSAIYTQNAYWLYVYLPLVQK